MNRIRVPLALLVAGLFVSTCAPMQTGTSPAPNPGAPRLAGPCRAVKNADAPIICVDDSASTLTVSPDPFVVHEKLSTGSAASPAVQWFTTSGSGALKIHFEDERCVRNVSCAAGHCTAVANKLNGAKEQRCKYDIELTGHPTLDPEGILVGCCVPGGG